MRPAVSSRRRASDTASRPGGQIQRSTLGFRGRSGLPASRQMNDFLNFNIHLARGPSVHAPQPYRNI